MRNHADNSNSKRSVWHGHKKLLRLAAACQMDRNYRARNQRLQRLRRSSRMSHVERCLSVQVTEPGPALETSGRESDKPFEGGKPMCCPSEHEVQPWLYVYLQVWDLLPRPSLTVLNISLPPSQGVPRQRRRCPEVLRKLLAFQDLPCQAAADGSKPQPPPRDPRANCLSN